MAEYRALKPTATIKHATPQNKVKSTQVTAMTLELPSESPLLLYINDPNKNINKTLPIGEMYVLFSDSESVRIEAHGTGSLHFHSNGVHVQSIQPAAVNTPIRTNFSS